MLTCKDLHLWNEIFLHGCAWVSSLIFEKKTTFFLNEQYFFPEEIRGHSEMTSPQKCQVLDPPSPYVTVSHFSIIPFLPVSPGK